MSFTITNPAIEINNTPVTYLTNSVSSNEGLYAINVRSVTAGGNSVDVVASIDLSTAIGEIKLELPPNAENLNLIKSWKQAGVLNIVLSQQDTSGGAVGYTASMGAAFMTNSPNTNYNADGSIEVIFKGTPLT